MEYDAIVIGAGLGGLTSASRLAVLGKKVLVIEKHLVQGGYATNFKRKGYNFDVSLHGVGGLEGGGNLHKILSGCKIIDKIKPLKSDIAYTINHNNEYIEIPNDIDNYKKLLINRFKGNSKDIETLFVEIERFKNGFERFILNNDPLKKIHKDVLLFIKWSSASTYEIVKSYVNNEEFIRLFTALWSYYGLPPKKLVAMYYFIPWISYHMGGKYYIEGGSQRLSDSFVETIKEYGGDVLLNSKVDKIICENGYVQGVKLENGDTYKCKYLISNANPIDTIKMMPLGSLKMKEVKKILHNKIGCSLSQLYIGLDCNPRELNIHKDEVFFFNGDSHEQDYERALSSDYENSGFLLTNYNSMDSTLNIDRKGVITMTYIDNYEFWSDNKETYNSQKKYSIDKMIERLEKYYKGISEHIVVAELGTPKTMERYTNNPKGAVYGYAQYINQSGKHRLKKYCSIKNLSFVGAWTNPGGGYEGVISGGMVEANRIYDKNLI